MTTTFTMAEGLALPSDATNQVFSFMGRRGSGKSYSCGRLIEMLLEKDRQVVIVDPVGIWHGLRLAADGKAAGFEIPILGGQHADIPLLATAGKVVAELVASRALSVVLDVSEFTGADQRRFVAEFCQELFHAKKRHRSAVMVVFEEAQEFVPQNVRGETARMVGAVERMIKLGRNFGIGTCLISQRPQSVNKDVLNQTEVMFAFQLTGPQERKAIAEWVKERGAGDREIANDLPSLPIGTALVWSPQWLKLFGRYKILPKRTFDASATPKGGLQDALALAPIDLAQLTAAMQATIEQAEGEDPERLREEITRLNAQVRRLAGEVDDARRSAPAAPPVEVIVERRFVPPEILTRLGMLVANVDDLHASIRAGLSHAEKLRTSISAIEGNVREISQQMTASAPDPLAGVTGRAPRTSVSLASLAPSGDDPPGRRRTAVDASNGDYHTIGVIPIAPARPRDPSRPGDNAGPTRILRALAARGASLTRTQIATLACMAPTGGTLRTYLGALGTQGLIARTQDGYELTPAGSRQAGPVPRASSPRDLIALWRDKLTGKARDMLELLAAEHELTRPQIAERLGLDLAGGTFRTYLGSLGSLGLTTRGRNGIVKINPELAL